MSEPHRQIVFSAFQLSNKSDGGLESATRIFEAMAGDHDWTFVTTRETAFTARWRAGGARVIVSPLGERASRAARALAYTRWAGRILAEARSGRAQLIHANDIRALNAASIPAQLLGLPVVLTVRDTKAQGEGYGRHWRRAARKCARIVTLSEEMGRIVAQGTGAAPGKLRTINSIVDLERFVPPAKEERTAAREALNIAVGEFAVGCIGAVRDKKNQLELIERALPPLLAASSAARLHLFGDFHPETDAYAGRCAKAAAVAVPAGRVVFHGHLPDMAPRLKALDAVVVSSRREGLARAMIEGMACGVPVVSFDVCSAREMLEETGAGIVVPQGDHVGLAGALARLAADPEERARMGGRGREVAESRFDAARIRTEYSELYRELQGHQGERP